MSITAYMGKPSEGMQYRNHAAWMSVADFLARQNLRTVLAERAKAAAARGPACGGGAAAAQAAINFGYNARTLPPVPDGNHGDHFLRVTNHG